MSRSPTTLANRYCLLEEIGRGGMGVVYRAMPFENPAQTVAIKIIRTEGEIRSETLQRFQQEAALMSQLYHPGIISFLELGSWTESQDQSTGTYIVMEYAHGLSLKEALAREPRSPLGFFFEVAIQIAQALDYTHSKGILHRDIKPQNLMVSRTGKDAHEVAVKILDFGVARLTDVMHFSGSSDAARRDMAGTPLYMAPEQTALVRGTVDHRADLYSLGCVLYEMLSGHPPFDDPNRARLERHHVYTAPDSLHLHRSDVPGDVVEIIHRLLAKSPDERYQSAFGLAADLTAARQRHERAPRARPTEIATWTLGLRDRISSATGLMTLVGRDREIEVLTREFAAASRERGRSRLTVISGDAGSGKSRVLAEFRNHLLERKIRFVSGIFTPHSQDLPFHALANALNDYLRSVRYGQAFYVEQLRNRLKSQLGPSAHSIARRVPGLKVFIQDIPDSENDLEQDATQPAFTRAFSDFTRCLADDTQPFVFLLDDLQWADQATLDMLDHFVSHNNTERFYMVITHRPNEEAGAHNRYTELLEKFRKFKRRHCEVDLGPLGLESTRAILTGMLQARDELGDDIVEYIQERGGGNPLSTIELVKSLVAHDLLYIAAPNAPWTYSMTAIRSFHPRWINIDLALSRLRYFTDLERQVLEVGSTLGQTFQRSLLTVGGIDDELASRSLQRALDEGILLRTSLPSTPDNPRSARAYTFVHSRARLAIYASIPEDRKRTYHLWIAERLHQIHGSSGQPTSSDLSSNILFALAYHVHAGRGAASLAVQPPEVIQRWDVWHLHWNFAAGQAALASRAWEAAEHYFGNALTALTERPPQLPNIESMRQKLAEHLADVAVLQRQYRTASERYRQLLASSLPEHRQARLAAKWVNLQLSAGVISEGIDILAAPLRGRSRLSPLEHLTGRLLATWRLFIAAAATRLGVSRPLRRVRSLLQQDPKPRGGNQDLFDAGGSYLLWLAGRVYHWVDRESERIMLDRAMRRLDEAHPTLTARLLADYGTQMIERIGRPGHLWVRAAEALARRQRDPATLAYVLLTRARRLEYREGRNAKALELLREAERLATQCDDRLLRAEATLALALLAFLTGDRKPASSIAQQLRALVPTRSPIAARAMLLELWVAFEANQRDIVAQLGLGFLLRRDQVRARREEPFARGVRVLAAYARGEIAVVRAQFLKALGYFCDPHSEADREPMEEDFFATVFVSFARTFTLENGQPILRQEDRRLVARGLLDRRRNLPSNHNSAHNAMAALLASMQDAAGLPPDQAAWSSVAAPVAPATAGISGPSDAPRNNLGSSEGRHRWGAFVHAHLELLDRAMSQASALELDLDQSCALLRKHHTVGRIAALLLEGDSGALTPYPSNAADSSQEGLSLVAQYLSPYTHLRSTLFLPVSDSPWFGGARQGLGTTTHTAIQTMDAPALAHGQTLVTHEPPSNSRSVNEGATLVSNAPAQGTGEGIPSSASNQAWPEPPHVDAPSASPDARMNAIVPLRDAAGVAIGVLFVEDLLIASLDTTQVRFELDFVGRQLGLLIAWKQSSAPGAIAIDRHPPGYSFEDTAPWLVHAEGELRSGRESVWYLGLKVSSRQYLLAHCSIRGRQDERERMSRMLWIYLHMARAAVLAQGREEMNLQDLRDELTAGLSALGRCDLLDHFALSMSLFDAHQRRVACGHFGHERPVCLGSEARIRPWNRSVARLQGHVDVRYWEVFASLDGPHIFLAAGTTAGLDAPLNEEQAQHLQDAFANIRGVQDIPAALHQVVSAALIPRTYVAVVLPQGAHISDVTDAPSDQEPKAS